MPLPAFLPWHCTTSCSVIARLARAIWFVYVEGMFLGLDPLGGFV